jgi:hypothetical protein
VPDTILLQETLGSSIVQHRCQVCFLVQLGDCVRQRHAAAA